LNGTRTHQLLVYDDDDDMGENMLIVKNAESSLAPRREIGLEANSVLMTPEQDAGLYHNIRIGSKPL
jgi:hypothetical protein